METALKRKGNYFNFFVFYESVANAVHLPKSHAV